MAFRVDDALIEREPIGLADSFADLSKEAFSVELGSEEPVIPGETIYFGLSLPTEEIAELKAEAVEAIARGSGGYLVKAKILAVDAALLPIARKTLAGNAESPAANAGGPLWAKGVKQMNGVYAFLVNAPGGLITAEQLDGIAKVAKRNAGVVKLTHAQRVIVLATAAHLDSIESELTSLGLRVGVLHHGVRNIRSCCGALCKWCVGVDAINAAIAIDKRLFGRATNFDVKIAVSDCMRNCSESFCADIGVIGADGSYKLLVGGRGSRIPFRAVQAASGIKPAELPDAVVSIVDWYQKTAKPKERLWKTLERLGAADLEGFDFAIELPENAADGIDELQRLKAHISRAAGAAILRRELGFHL